MLVFELLFSPSGSIMRWRFFIGAYVALPTFSLSMLLLGYGLAFLLNGNVWLEYSEIEAVLFALKRDQVLSSQSFDLPTTVFCIFALTTYIGTLWATLCLGIKRLRDLNMEPWLIIFPMLARAPVTLIMDNPIISAGRFLIILGFEILFLFFKSRITKQNTTL